MATLRITMREIKFRGKRLDNGEWIYGDLHIRTPFPHIHSEIDHNRVNIDPHTVGQFTGLHDKNGKEIYEGDIVDSHLQGVSKVLYDSGQYTVESKNYSTALTYRIAIHAVIIGNIHDNPELLKTE